MAVPWRAGLAVFAVACASGCLGVGDNAASVSLQGGDFEPGTVTIHAGGVVVFHVVQGTHTVDFVETGGVSVPASGDLEPGARHVVTFQIPGTFHYFCAYHSHRVGVLREGMTGTVVVK